MAARVPSSHGSLDGGGDAAAEAEPAERGDSHVGRSDEEADGFDSEEFREWLRERASRRRDGGRPRREGRGRRNEAESEEDERGAGGKGWVRVCRQSGTAPVTSRTGQSRQGFGWRPLGPKDTPKAH